jgi:hypothetical protein
VFHGVKEMRNILLTIKRQKVNWIGHILRGNCLPKRVIDAKIEANIEVTGIRGGRHSGYWMTSSKREDIGN